MDLELLRLIMFSKYVYLNASTNFSFIIEKAALQFDLLNDCVCFQGVR